MITIILPRLPSCPWYSPPPFVPLVLPASLRAPGTPHLPSCPWYSPASLRAPGTPHLPSCPWYSPVLGAPGTLPSSVNLYMYTHRPSYPRGGLAPTPTLRHPLLGQCFSNGGTSTPGGTWRYCRGYVRLKKKLEWIGIDLLTPFS